MAKSERQLIEVTDRIFLSQQVYVGRKDGVEQFNVCVKTENGELAAMEIIVRGPGGDFSYKDTNIGQLGSHEFAGYIQKFQFGTGLSALEGRPVPKNEEELYQRATETYRQTKSLKKTARLLSLSEERTRRILFTTGDYTCDIHEKVLAALKEGKTLDETAEIVGVSRGKIHAYLPYGAKGSQ